jgi:chaperonin cofactor prefoldin
MARLHLVLAVALALLAQPVVPAEDASARQMIQLQAQMKKMQEQMNRIQATAETKERQKLMQAQLQTMRESLKLLSEPTVGPSLAGMSDAQATNELKKRHDLLERRMHVLQLMMDHMIQREQIMQTVAR